MDKFYVKQKRTLVSTNPSTSRETSTSRKSSEIFQSAPNCRLLGVANICSKIRHKIEDNLSPKISSKLYKTGKHSKSLNALTSVGASSGKYTLTSKNFVENEKSNADIRKIKLKTNNTSSCSIDKQIMYADCYNTPNDNTCFARSSLISYEESDEDEAQLSLNMAKTSLEDEIFKELEKAAHHENKLNEVLKTFDQIIFDFNDPELYIQSTFSINNDKNIKIKSELAKNEHLDCDALKDISHSKDKNKSFIDIDNKMAMESCCIKLEKTTHDSDCILNECNDLKKSSSTLSLTPRKCYQSPNSPFLRQMRHAFGKQQRSKSLLVLSYRTQIPLKTRSKSFCYHNSKEKTNNLKLSQNNQVLNPSNELVSGQNRSNQELKSKKHRLVDSSPKEKKKETKSQNKRSSNSNSSQFRNTFPKLKRTTFASNESVLSKFYIPTFLPNPNKTSDELLNKCLEKGQQILRKVESINTQRSQISSHNKKLLMRKKSNSNNKISKDNLTLRRKQWLHKLNYANEEKLNAPILESCKIIPPVLGETSDKHAELLVQVANATQLLTTKNRTITEEIENVITDNSFLKLVSKNRESDSDDSGHISTENMEISLNHTLQSLSSLSPSPSGSLCETSSTSSCSITESQGDTSERNGVVTKSFNMSEVLQKFERKAQKGTIQINSNENYISTPKPNNDIDSSSKYSTDSQFCTTYKVAEVESISVIRTHLEIYPNYTKEVTIRLH
ncbi:uncharacterized protein ACRADG_000980 [Cochliomyia hominivorax]